MIEGTYSLGFEGMAKVQKRIRTIMDESAGKDMKEAYLQGAIVIANEAKLRAPLGPTGNLKRGVFAARGDPNKRNALAGMNYRIAPHAHLVEYGTVKMVARPYFRPAITTKKDAAGRVIIDGLKKILEKHGA